MVNKIKEFRDWLHRMTFGIPMYEGETGDDIRPVDVTSEFRESQRKKRIARSKPKKKGKINK